MLKQSAPCLFSGIVFCLLSQSVFGQQPVFFPTPQKVKWEGKTSAQKTFTLKPGKNIPFSTLQEYKGFLRQWGFQEKPDGIPFVLQKLPAAQCEKAALPPYQKKTFLDYTSLQTYMLSVTDQKITIKACGEDGFYYALTTFRNLWEDAGGNNVTLYKAEILDYPAFPVRGVFEGGYGIWSLEGRLNVLDWMGKVKLNSYLYGPKSDSKIRRRWRELYDDIELFSFKRALEKAKRRHIQFGYTISPPQGIEYGSEEDFQMLLKKVRQMQSLGIKSFVLAFDDTMGAMYFPSDRKKFSNLGEAESYLANKLYQALKTYDPETVLVMVPEIYAGVYKMAYTESIAKNLLPEIYIGWTGPEIGAPKIDAQDLQAFIEFYGKMPTVGDNWGALFPMLARHPDIHKYTTHFGMNPYNLQGEVPAGIPGASEPELMPVQGASLAEFGWNPYFYDPDKVLDTLSAVYFKKEARDVFKLFMHKDFYDFTAYYPLKTDYQPPLEKKARLILEKKNEKELSEYVRSLLAALEKAINAPQLIETGCYDTDMGKALFRRVTAAQPYFEKLRAALMAVQEAVEKKDPALEVETLKTYLSALRGKK